MVGKKKTKQKTKNYNHLIKEQNPSKRKINKMFLLAKPTWSLFPKHNFSSDLKHLTYETDLMQMSRFWSN